MVEQRDLSTEDELIIKVLKILTLTINYVEVFCANLFYEVSLKAVDQLEQTILKDDIKVFIIYTVLSDFYKITVCSLIVLCT